MNLFFDTSALVKYFHPEPGTVEVIELIENPVHQIWVSDLARIEFISALCRKLRRGDINNVQLQETLSGFDIEWAQFNHQPLLRGDMSIVGPRPLSVLHYERDLAQGNVTRFLIKGGLLGLDNGVHYKVPKKSGYGMIPGLTESFIPLVSLMLSICFMLSKKRLKAQLNGILISPRNATPN